MMDKSLCIHVGLHPPSKYSQLSRSLFSESTNNSGSNYNLDLNDKGGCAILNNEDKNFNITVGKFNPNTAKFNPLTNNFSLKSPQLDTSIAKKSGDLAQETNFDNLSSLSSYDFSKLGSNLINNRLVASSSGEKSVRFSKDTFSSHDSLKTEHFSSFESIKQPSLNQEGSKNLESYVDQQSSILTSNLTPNQNQSGKPKDLLDVFRKIVKHVITVNRFKKTGSDFMAELLGMNSQGIENVGFSDELKNNLSLNPTNSFNNAPLLNKGSTTSLCEAQMNALNFKNKDKLNVTYNKKLAKINDKHKMIQQLLDELDDPLKLLSNDAPLNNILDEHVNTSRLVHPFYINYYPLKVEVEEDMLEEEEVESARKSDPTPVRKKISRPEDYPALWAIYTNPKNGITSTL